ncbi:TRAP transporter permease, partial [Chloroflexota bacterium]
MAGILTAIHQLFHLYQYTGVIFMQNSYLYILLGIFLSLVFIVFPATASAPRDRVPWYDTILFLLTLGICSYYAWHGPTMIVRSWEFIAPLTPTVLSFLLWFIVLEGVRRTAGMALLVVVVIFSFYPLYAGYMPGIISGFSLTVTETARYHSMSIESMVGIPMRVVGTLFIGFIIMGVALVVTGGGTFFINLASAILGTYRGGPAKVSIVASGLFGSMSGSVVSNVLATGSITIPAMKRIGFPPHYAGAIEACASTGGVLMPPIMGATAFVMASLLGIPYIQVAIAAAIPSFLYYFGLFMQIDAYAGRVGLKGLPREELPSVFQTLKQGWFYIFTLVLLIWLLLYLRQEAVAPFYATALLLLLANVQKDTRLNARRLQEFTVQVGRLLAELTGMLAAIGLIIGSLSVTGMAVTFSGDLVRIAGDNVPGLLVMGALTSLILGVGMTVTACYIFLAIVLAPALVTAGLNPLAVHLFLMYWGMISFITPPVSVGAYAAASVAQSKPMRTGFEAMRLGAV